MLTKTFKQKVFIKMINIKLKVIIFLICSLWSFDTFYVASQYIMVEVIMVTLASYFYQFI